MGKNNRSMKNKFMKALDNDFDNINDFISINSAIKKSKQIKIIDLVDMSSRTMGQVAEVLALLKNCDNLEIIHFNGGEA